MVSVASKEQGKSDFVRDVLSKNAKANPKDVNDAWKGAGRSGEISPSLVHKIRADMGVTGNLRARLDNGSNGVAKGKPKASKKGPKPKGLRAQAVRPAWSKPSAEPAPKAASGGQMRQLEEIEGQIDRLIFTIMGIGKLPEVEDALRKARRLVARSIHD